MLNECKAYELIKKSKASMKDGKLVVPQGTSSELIDELRAHKADIVDYLSGECFSFQAAYMDSPAEWVVQKCSAIGDVWYPPVDIFCGSAHEVDVWCAEHRDAPLFSGKYTSKYTVCHR